ncbi:hypothetical protein R3P38DRAFT_3308325 [Favolaschia claudopus]|uniref:Tubby C-terminal-like domain-containing protein n=1 Tax=Favolaschia claudopus TaxID=2862362 RepID=A0AAW0D0M6_9AGAR
MPLDTNLNPYGAWFDGNSRRTPRSSQASGSRSAPPPSLYGVLPYVSPNPNQMPIQGGAYPNNTPSSPRPATTELITFYLTSPSSPHAHANSQSAGVNVLNCTVLDARSSRVQYTISTDNSLAGYTVFKSVLDGRSVGLIEWGRGKTSVEVRGAVQKQETKTWLRVSRNQTYRTMTVRGFQYTWSPDDQYINLCSTGPTSTFLGRISRGDETVVIELTPDAIQLNLQDASIVAAVLLLCGQNID